MRALDAARADLIDSLQSGKRKGCAMHRFHPPGSVEDLKIPGRGRMGVQWALLAASSRKTGPNGVSG
jgi:hypothetical protein